jgi:putative oxidoreductase
MLTRRDAGLLLLRVGVGTTLAAHGLPKLLGGPGRKPPELLSRAFGANYAAAWEKSGPEQFGQALETMKVPAPKLSAWASSWAELGGGLALAAGVATPLAAAVVVGNMAVAVGKAHWKTGFYGQGGYEFALTLGLAAATIGLAGPGKFSVDALLS